MFMRILSTTDGIIRFAVNSSSCKWSACNFPIYNVFTAQVVYILREDRRRCSAARM
jgi:hypothetical protein